MSTYLRQKPTDELLVLLHLHRVQFLLAQVAITAIDIHIVLWRDIEHNVFQCKTTEGQRVNLPLGTFRCGHRPHKIRMIQHPFLPRLRQNPIFHTVTGHIRNILDKSCSHPPYKRDTWYISEFRIHRKLLFGCGCNFVHPSQVDVMPHIDGIDRMCLFLTYESYLRD